MGCKRQFKKMKLILRAYLVMESAKTSGKDSSRSSVSPMATAGTEVVKKEEVVEAMT